MMDYIGILPAAGKGTRLRPLNYPKELLPIRYRWSEDGAAAMPSLLVEYSLDALRRAGAERAVLIVSDTKPEILRYLRDGSDSGVKLAYVVQSQPLGLAHAVDQAYAWSAGSGCGSMLALPDTVFEPLDALARVRAKLEDAGCDLALGVFPTDRPEQLGPVSSSPEGRVLRVLDKPERTELRNTWALAAWTPRFSTFLHEHLAVSRPEDVLLGGVFDAACREGLDVRAVHFPGGRFRDLGTPLGIAELLWGERPAAAP